jgi:F-type H+-transporting ATPase subunit b
MQIDWWTLALQAVNFLILIWLLSRFLYRPIVDIVAKRREAARKLLADAEAERARIKDAHTEIDQIREGFSAERQKIVAEARIRADEAAKRLIADAKADATKLLAEAKVAAARAEAALARDRAREAEQLALAIAQKLLARLRPGEATAAFLDELCEKVRSLPPQSKAALENGGAIEVVTAAMLSPDEQSHVQQTLSGCLDGDTSFTFRTDPALIAGFALSSRDIVLQNNWREDLRAIGAELEREESKREEAKQDAVS